MKWPNPPYLSSPRISLGMALLVKCLQSLSLGIVIIPTLIGYLKILVQQSVKNLLIWPILNLPRKLQSHQMARSQQSTQISTPVINLGYNCLMWITCWRKCQSSHCYPGYLTTDRGSVDAFSSTYLHYQNSQVARIWRYSRENITKRHICKVFWQFSRIRS